MNAGGDFRVAVLALTLLLAALGAAGASGDEGEGESFRGGLDPGIVKVESGGYWKLDGRFGSFRVVVTKACSPEHCFDEVYLQWIEEMARARESTQMEEIRTQRVPEAGDLTVVRKVEYVSRRGKDMFQLDLVNSYTLARGRLCLLPEPAAGRYAVREGRCR